MRTLLFLILLFVTASPAAAHDTWMIPLTWTPSPGETLSLDLTSGMHFPNLESPMKPERIESSGIRVGGTTRPLLVGPSLEKSLRLRAPVDTSGLVTIWAEAGPRFIELGAREVAEYFGEIGADSSVGRAWDSIPEPRRWTEIYRKHAKALALTLGARSDSSWGLAVGMRFEIVPVNNPLTVKRGGFLTVAALFQGQPVAGQRLFARVQGGPPAIGAATDAKGRARFKLAPGAWMISGTRVARSPSPEAVWSSDFTTTTFWISP